MGITKYIFPVLAGVVAGIILIYSGENYIHSLYPYTINPDLSPSDAIAKYIHHLPDQAFVMLLANYAIGSFVAGLIATFISKRITLEPALAVGIVLSLGGLYNVITLPQPLWVSFFSMLIYLPFAYFGYMLIRKKQRVA